MGVQEMGSSGEEEFSRWVVQEMESSRDGELGSLGDGEFASLGVQEMGSS